MDDSLDLASTRGFQHVQRPARVRGYELTRVEVRVRDRDQRPEMEDHIATGYGSADGLGVREITAEDLELAHDILVGSLKPTVVAARGVADEGADRGAATDERLAR